MGECLPFRRVFTVDILSSSVIFKTTARSKKSPWGDFLHIVSGENSAENFPPKKCWEKMEFSAEKVLKNSLSKKFRGIFRGK
jgi:hypothetical protein